MARVKRGVTKHRRHKEVLQRAKGFKGARGRHVRPAKEGVLHALSYAYAHRRERKGDMRKLWIVRIGAATRNLGMPYGRFINGLLRADIRLDRKALAALAVDDPSAFAQLVEKAKAAPPSQ
ncbi:MAG: 50S ribosomal protein L20 [Dehalococcoidia bacterium]|nr:50S ribosomal protein L20 [Dehalococcoidia bacterium]